MQVLLNAVTPGSSNLFDSKPRIELQMPIVVSSIETLFRGLFHLPSGLNAVLLWSSVG